MTALLFLYNGKTHMFARNVTILSRTYYNYMHITYFFLYSQHILACIAKCLGVIYIHNIFSYAFDDIFTHSTGLGCYMYMCMWAWVDTHTEHAGYVCLWYEAKLTVAVLFIAWWFFTFPIIQPIDSNEWGLHHDSSQGFNVRVRICSQTKMSIQK